ncbi:hypothetical protein GQ42DRAFT_156015 [Ramicandelaber brevisporus]|nr:hypothetical protein GQ42DRAFT_156015 [Ramicandelaber brevisporus]
MSSAFFSSTSSSPSSSFALSKSLQRVQSTFWLDADRNERMNRSNAPSVPTSPGPSRPPSTPSTPVTPATGTGASPLEAKISLLQEQLRKAGQHLRALTTENGEISEQLEAAVNRNVELETKLLESTQLNDDNQGKIDAAVQQALQRVTSDHEAEVASLKSSLDTTTVELNSVRELLEGARKEAADAKDAIGRAEEEARKAKAASEAAEAKLAAQAEIAAAAAEAAEAATGTRQEETSEISSTVKVDEAVLLQARADADAARAATEEAKVEAETIRNELASVKKQYDDARSAAISLVMKLDNNVDNVDDKPLLDVVGCIEAASAANITQSIEKMESAKNAEIASLKATITAATEATKRAELTVEAAAHISTLIATDAFTSEVSSTDDNNNNNDDDGDDDSSVFAEPDSAETASLPPGIVHLVASVVKKARVAMKDARDIHQSEIDNLNQQHQDASDVAASALQASESEREQLDDDYQKLLAKLGSMKSVLETKMQAEGEQVKRAKADLAELQARYTADITARDQTNVKLASNIQQLRQDLESSKEDAVQLRESLKQLQVRQARETADFEAASEQSEAQLRQLNQQLRAQTEQLDRERAKSLELTSAVSGLQEQVDQLNQSAEEWQLERNISAKSIRNLQTALDEMERTRESSLQSGLASLHSELNEYKSQLASTRSKLVSMQKEVDAARQAVAQTASLQSKVDNLTHQLGQAHKEFTLVQEKANKDVSLFKQELAETSIDRNVMGSLLVSFFALEYGDPRRYETIQTIASMLEFSNDQRRQIGLPLIKKASPPSAAASPVNSHQSHHGTPQNPEQNHNQSNGSDDGQANEGEPGQGNGNFEQLAASESLAERWIAFLSRP